MKILIDLTSLADNFSGIELYALSVAKELIKNEKNSYILVFKNKIHKEFVKQYNNVENIIIFGNNKLIFNQFLLPWKLKFIKADKYLFLSFPEPFFWFKSNTINTIHDVSCWDCPGSNKWYMLLYWKIMFRKVAIRKGKVLTVSEFSKNRINKVLNINKDRITVTYSAPLQIVLDAKMNDMNSENVKKKYDLPSKYILCLSTLEPRKNLNFFIKAYEELFNSGLIDLDIVLAGRKGWMMDEFLERLPNTIKSKIHITGFIDDEDLPYIYRYADFFVFPSKYEGFGVPPIESLLSDTIVLTSNVSAMPEILGKSVIYYEHDDIESLKANMLEILKLSDLEKDILVNRSKKMIEKYTWLNVSSIVNDCINGG